MARGIKEYKPFLMAHSKKINIHINTYIKLLAHFSLEKIIIKIVSNEKNCQALPINITI